MTQYPFIFRPCIQTTNFSLHWRRTYCPCLRSRKLPLGWSGSYRNLRSFVRPYHRTTRSRRLRMIGSPCAPSWTSSSSAFTSSSWQCMLALFFSSGPAGASPNHTPCDPFPDWVTYDLCFPMMCWCEGKEHFADRIYLTYCTCKMMYWPWLWYVFLNNAVAKQNNHFKQRKQYVCCFHLTTIFFLSPLRTMKVCLAAADMSVSQQYCLTADIGFGLKSISCSGDQLR